MINFILKRIVSTIPVLLMTSILIFSMMRLLPGDPVLMVMGGAQGDVSEEQIEAARREYGFDKPVYVQYVIWLKNAARGDLGRSIHTRQPVIDVVRPRIMPTVHIGLTAWIMAILIAVPLGAYTAQKQNSWSDWVGTVVTLTGAAMPYFLIGGLLIYFVSLRLGWLPASGYVPLSTDVGKSIASTILPSISLALGLTAVTARQARSSFIEVMNNFYIRTARAKGLSEPSVVMRHAFRNAMLPVVTIIGLQLGMLFGGTVVTETVFAVPGVGRLLIDSILGRDYAVVQAVVLYITFTVITANLMVDICYGLLDPRSRT
jgi:peptide/nickel transport system permease protein